MRASAGGRAARSDGGAGASLRTRTSHRRAPQDGIASKAEELKALKTDLELQSGGEVRELSKRVDATALRLAKGTGVLDARQEDLKVSPSWIKGLSHFGVLGCFHAAAA